MIRVFSAFTAFVKPEIELLRFVLSSIRLAILCFGIFSSSASDISLVFASLWRISEISATASSTILALISDSLVLTNLSRANRSCLKRSAMLSAVSTSFLISPPTAFLMANLVLSSNSLRIFTSSFAVKKSSSVSKLLVRVEINASACFSKSAILVVKTLLSVDRINSNFSVIFIYLKFKYNHVYNLLRFALCDFQQVFLLPYLSSF